MKNLSIIVPIYKAEKYLGTCIASILEQTYSDYELILVNDGSPDRCPEICEEYAKKDSRIRVIHQKNNGSVAAREKGLMASTGRYVTFPDSDDWLDSNMYEYMMQKAVDNDADIVAVGFIEESNCSIERGNGIESGFYRNSSLDDLFQHALYTGMFYESGIFPALWSKIIRRDLFFSNIEFPDKTIRMGDDAALTYPVIARSSRIVVDNEFRPYHYRILQGSLAHSYDELYFQRAIKLLYSLAHNLFDCKKMEENLIYYSLYIIQIGINQLLSSKSKKHLHEKAKELYNTLSQFNQIEMTRNITWDGFDESSRKELNMFMDGHIRRCMCYHYAKKIKQKLLSVLLQTRKCRKE